MSSSALAAGLLHLRSQLAAQQRSGDSDEQLLQDFATHRDEGAFAALLRRHGPMVLHVCRRVLGHEQDAEDAFQATFLVLAQSAASLRKKTAMAGWLYGTAYRTALKAKQFAVRRRKHEEKTPARSPANPSEELLWREVQSLLDEEIASLPEKYRSVFVLCCLEDQSQTEAARQLGLKVRTASNRLAEARTRLALRLRRHGVELTAVLAAFGLAAKSTPALSAGLLGTTIKAAAATAADEGSAGLVSASVAALVEDNSPLWSLGKTKLVLLLFAASLLGSGAFVHFHSIAADEKRGAPAAEKERSVAPAQLAAKNEDKDAITYSGRVLEADGKAIAGAKVYYYFITFQEETVPVRAVTDAQGRFAFALSPKDIPLSADAMQADPRKTGHLIAKADGYTFAWQGVFKKQAEWTLRVAVDDTPLTGRIIDLQGKPLAGLRVTAWSVAAPETSDLTPFVKALRSRESFYVALQKFVPNYLHSPFYWRPRVTLLPAATTDTDGRFRLKGFAKEQLIELRIEGPVIETQNVFVMNRLAPREGGALLSAPRIKDPVFGPSERVVVLTNGFDHPLPPGLTVIGTVRDAETRRPIPKAIVESYVLAGTNLAQNTLYHTVADEQGRYRFTGLPRGQGNRIRIRPPADQPYIPVVKDVPVQVVKDAPAMKSFAAATVDVTLGRGVWVDVTVADKHTGRPVPGEVSYFVYPEKPSPERPFEQPFADEYNRNMPIRNNGTFRFAAVPRRAILAFRADCNKYPIAREAATIHFPFGVSASNFQAFAEINPKLGDAPVKVKFVLDAGRIVKGKLVDPEGRPLFGGALASGLRSDWDLGPEMVNTADFTVLDLYRPRLLCFVHEGKKLAGSVVVYGDEKVPITVKMKPWATVSGRLLDAKGKPIPNATLWFTEIPVRKPGQPMSLDTGLHVVQHIGGQPSPDPHTDEQGRFRVERLVPGLKYNLALIDERGATSLEQIKWEGLVFANLVLRPGEAKDLGKVKLQPFPERAPGVEKPAPATPQPAQPPVKSYMPRNPSAPTPDKGEKRETKSVTGQVLDPEGKPLAGTRVTVLAEAQRVLRDGALSMAQRVVGQGETDRQGRFRLTVPRTTSLRNWMANVVAAHAAYGVAWQPFDADAAQPTVVIRLHPEQILRGRLMDLQGQPVAGAKLQIVSIDKKEGAGITLDGFSRHMGFLWPKPIDTDKNGQFAIHGVGDGATVALLTEHERCSPQRLELTAGQEKTFVLPPTRLLEGRVLYADTGKPVPHVEVVGWGVVGKTDEHGWFRLRPTSGPIYNQEESGLILAYAPEGEPYLNVQKGFRWPKAAMKHRVDLALPRGVLVRGRVTEEDGGKPVAGALVFYETQLNNPNGKRAEAGPNNFANGRNAVTTKPDGTFQIACHHGPGYVTIEGPNPDYVLGENGGYDQLLFGKRGGQPWRSHGFAAVDLKVDAKPPELAVALRKGVTLKASISGPAGQPVGDLQVFCPLEAFAVFPVKLRGNRLELHGCDAEKSLRVMIFDAKNQGGHGRNVEAECGRKAVADNPGTVRLGAHPLLGRGRQAPGQLLPRPISGTGTEAWEPTGANDSSVQPLPQIGATHGRAGMVYLELADSRRDVPIRSRGN